MELKEDRSPHQPQVKAWNYTDTERVKKELKASGMTDALTLIRILEDKAKDADRTRSLAMKKIFELSAELRLHGIKR